MTLLSLIQIVLFTSAAAHLPTSCLKTINFSDHEIKKTAYSEIKVPENFYTDPQQTKHHDDVQCILLPKSANNQIEAESLVLEQLKRKHQKNIIIEEKNETNAYYEFTCSHTINMPSSGPSIHTKKHQIFYRVLKKNFIEIDQLEITQKGEEYRMPLDGEAFLIVGTLKEKVTKENTQWIGEFLWWTTHKDNVGHKVLDSSTVQEIDDHFFVSFPYAAISYGTTNVNDMIYVRQWTLTIDKNTKKILLKDQLIKKIKGHKGSTGLSIGP